MSSRDQIELLSELVEENDASRDGLLRTAGWWSRTPLGLLCTEIAIKRARDTNGLKVLLNNWHRVGWDLSCHNHNGNGRYSWKLGDRQPAVLESVRRGEEYLKAKYQSAVSRLAAGPVRTVVEEQLDQIADSCVAINRVQASWALSECEDGVRKTRRKQTASSNAVPALFDRESGNSSGFRWMWPQDDQMGGCQASGCC